jgi:RNA polymerase sigma-70 factor (ECF subfamily)
VAGQQLDVELLLTALPAPAGTWHDEPAAPVDLFKQVPLELQRRRSDNWLAWNVGRVRPDPFAVLFERYWQPISAFCITIVGTRDEAEDAAAETMSRAFATLSRREERPDFRPWIHAIARNAALDRIRQRGRGPQLSLDGEELDVPVGDEPDVVLGRRERLERLMADLHALAERQRAAIVMRELSGMTYEEIAETLGTTPIRAKGLVADARASLSARRDGRQIGCGEYRHAVAAGRGRVPRGQRLAAHRDTCPDCRAYARPRLLSGVFFLPIIELFSRAGRRIAEAAGPAASHAGPAASVKLAAAASVVALAVPAAQHVGDDPRPVRDGGSPAAQAPAPASTHARDARESGGATARTERASSDRRDASERADARAERRAARERAADDGAPADAAPAPAAPAPAGDGRDEPASNPLRDTERLVTQDVPDLVERTTDNLTQQLQDTAGSLPGVDVEPGEIRVDLGELIPK